MKRKNGLAARLSGFLLIALTAFMLLPVLMVLNMSVRPATDITTNALAPPSRLAWENYTDVFDAMAFPTGLANTLLITTASVVLVVLIGSAAAWAIARHTRRWTTVAYHIFVSGLTVPVFVLLTPLYLLMRQLGLLDTHVAVILANVALNLPFAVFFYASFLSTVPADVEEASAVDGCGLLRTYLRVVLPLLKPATATIAVFVSIGMWNDLVIPLVLLTSPERSTLTLSVYSFLGTQGRFETQQLFPAVVLATLPLFVAFLVLQRRVVAGIVAGVGKG